MFTPKDRVKLYVDMKARDVAEVKAKEESASSSTNVIHPVALHAAPALFPAPKKRRNNPVHKTKQLGIAGLFSEENEVYIYDESDSGASTSGAAPASVIESKDEEVPLGNLLRMNLKLEARFVLPRRHLPIRGNDYIPAMPCVADYKGEPHRPKTAPFNSHSRVTINVCVARPVSRKELLQSPPAQASMKAEWDRLRNKMVWDEDKVREWSEVAREAQKGNYEFNFGYLFGICVEL